MISDFSSEDINIFEIACEAFREKSGNKFITGSYSIENKEFGNMILNKKLHHLERSLFSNDFVWYKFPLNDGKLYGSFTRDIIENAYENLKYNKKDVNILSFDYNGVWSLSMRYSETNPPNDEKMTYDLSSYLYYEGQIHNKSYTMEFQEKYNVPMTERVIIPVDTFVSKMNENLRCFHIYYLKLQ